MADIGGPTRRRGRPTTATREDVLAAALAAYESGGRVDAQAIASALGISRTTIYRWFGPRHGLVGEVLAHDLRRTVAVAEASVGGSGAERIVDTVLLICTYVARSQALAAYLRFDQINGLRVITASNGRVHPAAVAELKALIQRRMAGDGYQPPMDLDVLAFALVRLAEGFLYSGSEDAPAELNTDLSRLRPVLAGLIDAPRGG